MNKFAKLSKSNKKNLFLSTKNLLFLLYIWNFTEAIMNSAVDVQ